MKITFVLFVSIIALLSCSKDKEPDTTMGGSFVANWSVSESTSTTTGAPVLSIGFSASTVKVTDSTFKIVQSNRSPKQPWVDEFTDFELKPITLDYSLYSSVQGTLGNYSPNKDTLKITYTYAAGATTYVVKQKWTRK